MALDHNLTVQFLNLSNVRHKPKRADRACGGIIPTRAFRYCEALTTASALGWYVFSPMDFSLYWDGSETHWTFDGADSKWFPLGSAQLPGFSQTFDAGAPENVQGYSPPFLGALPEPGLIQIWSGLFARSKPGWSLLVRPPANIPRTINYEIYEGVVEADRWFGPLFTNVRLTKTHTPIQFRADFPLFQVQPLHRPAYSEATLNAFEVLSGVEALSPSDWSDYEKTVVKPSKTPSCPVGRNAVAIRQRRREEVAKQ